MTFDEELTFTQWHRLLFNCMPGAQLRDVSGRMLRFRNELCVAVGERPGLWRARERRGLHRLGFRPFASRRLCVWQWTLSLDELRAAAEGHPVLNGDGPPTREHERLVWFHSREDLMREQLRRVLSDVFAFEPGDLRLELPGDEEDDDWDEPDQADVRAS